MFSAKSTIFAKRLIYLFYLSIMEKSLNKYIVASYKLYDVTEGKKELVEETSADRPFVFLSGFGVTLPAFEDALVNLGKGECFDFSLTAEQAYGAYHQERVIELDKSVFKVDGKFDDAHIVVGAIVPLQNEDGNRFNGRILTVTADKVKVDLNRPFAGKKLNFVGKVIESHEADSEEITDFVNMLNGESGCGGCSGRCGGGSCEDGCGCH